MQMRKQELRAELGVEDPDEADEDADSPPQAARVARRASGSR